MAIQLTVDPQLSNLALGVVEVEGVQIAAAPESLVAYCRELAERTQTEGLRGGEERRSAVRSLLRAGGYKPAGRNKPAQEYLLRTVQDQQSLPSINNAVDLINAVSLDAGLPISLLAIERAGPRLLLRYGRAGESYVFNQGGQELDLEGLICVCRDEAEQSIPLGTPVKDSLLAKVTDQDRHLAACIYAPRAAIRPEELASWTDTLGRGFVRWCAAPRCVQWTAPEQR